ncbi:Mitochondrial distribution and morphology protein 12 [Marasmius tenuissimus]|uniref:Mitochondrial distribution and morphology protein 12 n=1 Tax=Marasmius tenuissimus TaxID=585030 RepID=A0ABR3A2C8_9AGAR|nr:Mitochondrial distribution and morphology protein 12 [Marasmius tenuissimus]
MSIDLEWGKLDSSLSSKLVDILNKQLSTTTRPSFIGPVEVTGLEFGTAAPDIELVDLRDIYRDFLEDDDEESESDRGPVKVTEGPDDEDEDGFEWVSRKAARLEEGLSQQQQLPPHLRFMRRSNPMDMFASTPNLPTVNSWNPNLGDYRPPFASFYDRLPLHERTPLQPPQAHQPSQDSDTDSLATPPEPPQNNNSTNPNLQLHFHVNWQSDLRITLTTSLLINYPSPMFMSLPIKLSVTGLIFNGEIAVAYEGERSRVHLCIVDELDPYGPAGDRPKRDTPPEPDDVESTTPLDEDSPPPSINVSRPGKPLPIGQRLLPSIFIESEIGQADKHVLKNVTRVERFIQDVIRKTVEEELVFPNFHTLVMGG